MSASDPHRCDDTCVCPIHSTPMYYAATIGFHACQHPGCQHATGVDLTELCMDDLRRLATERTRDAIADASWRAVT